MGGNVRTRFGLLAASARLALGIYALYLLLPWASRLQIDPLVFGLVCLTYLVITGSMELLGKPIFIWIVLVLDSFLCLGIISARNPWLFPLLILPGISAGLLKHSFKGYILLAETILQSLVFVMIAQPEQMKANLSIPMGADILIVNGISAFLGYCFFTAVSEGEQNKSLLDLIQINQQMGATLNYENVSKLLMSVITSMFDAHSYGFYVIEEKEREKMAILRGIQSPYNQVFLDFNIDMKDSLFAEVITEKKACIIDDIRRRNDRFLPRVRAFRCALLSPICFEEETLGLIFLISGAPNAYTKSQLELLNLLSNQFAVTIKNILLYRQTEVMAITDSLTGLYTHGHFQEQLARHLTEHKYSKKPLSLMILDVDHFKIINDQMGHPQGDYILRQMAGLIKNTVRPKDLVCRYGGDEFVLITPGLDQISAAAYAERIREAVENYPFVAGGKTARITLSAGVSSYPDTAETQKELIDMADKALYEAKNRGRNRIVYH